MARQIDDVEALRRYLRRLMVKSQHHAQGVEDVVLTLAGAIIWKKDKEPLVVREHDGDIANVLWAWFGGRKYAFVYDHEDGAIDMRRHSMRGKTIESFSAKNGSPRRIRLFFQQLTRKSESTSATRV